MTSTDVAVRDENAALSIRAGQEMWTDKQKAALSAMGIKDATNADLAVFMHVCQRTQLDPFTRQIYMIPRREKSGEQWVTKQTIQVGIDGFRVVRDRVAERTGCQVEFEDTVWFDADGDEHAVWLAAEPPAACRVVLVKYQEGRALRFPAVLRTASYIQADKNGSPVSQWRTQAEHMIEKCCEAFATRRAFPNDFAGVYLEEEMSRPAADPVPEHRKVTAADIVRDRDREPEPAAGRKTRASAPAAPKQLEELNAILAALPVAPDSERKAAEKQLLDWLGGGEWTASRSQVTAVHAELEKRLEAAEGDTEACVSALWTDYELSREPGDG